MLIGIGVPAVLHGGDPEGRAPGWAGARGRTVDLGGGYDGKLLHRPRL
jgi:hypothetical protein